ncbi:MAG TPA: tRNA epoxyqueuosine(34) reductase QueG [Candidatus Acidoferrales bacterium]|nr:tRNA epoxyqueuosine(34) reductase QueG [Candidatus Acidoferrales bacterium]
MDGAAERTRWICEEAARLGFDLCGVATASAAEEDFAELRHFPEWLARGYAGEMNYMRDPRRGDPKLALAGIRSVIVTALNYNSAHPYSTQRAGRDPGDSNGPTGWISRYAWGDDYHLVLGERLDALLAAMRAKFVEPFEARSYVDTGPLPERIAAKYAGLGWLAKNTCLINQQLGSWLFLGVIPTTLGLEPTVAPGAVPPRDLCGTCTRCLDACPTEAFPAPYVLDASRCISYLTIELRGAIPEEFRGAMGDAVFGCDICQDVCPWNRKAPVARLAAFQPRQRLARVEEAAKEDAGGASLCEPGLEWLAALTQEEFSAQFRRSAVKRAKWRGMVRNACVALGNARIAADSPAHVRILALIERLAQSPDEMIAEHARWALARLGAAAAAPGD